MKATELIKIYPKGSIVTHEFDTRRYIIIVDKLDKDNDTHIYASFGLDASNALHINDTFGCGCGDKPESFRLATDDECELLFNVITNYFKVNNLLAHKEVIRNSIKEELKKTISKNMSCAPNGCTEEDYLDLVIEAANELKEEV